MADPFYNKVSLLLPMNGVDSGTTFIDWGSIPKAVTRTNALIKTAISKYYGSSGYFDGTTDYLSVAASSDFQLCTLDFTVEAWIYMTAYKATGMRIVSIGGGTVGWDATGGVHVLLQQTTASGNLSFGISNNTGSPISGATTATMALNTWHHVALSVTGSTAYASINGVVQAFSIGSRAQPSTVPTCTIATIHGEAGAVAQAFQGYIQDVRITKGTARYTTDFIPPTSLLKNLIGVVIDDVGAPAVRTIRAYPRLTGYPLYTAQSTGGSFNIQVADTEYNVICLDDDPNTVYNDLISRVLPA